ncbi:hypothetical protein [Teichococcus oryzae]|nr:hypothetical protein [Pseudoroseomonas oryzae]
MKPVAMLLAALLALPGCNAFLSESTADVAGLAGAALSSAISDNGAVAAGIGLGVQSLARAGLEYTQRELHQAEQDSIARAAGGLPMGAVATWSITHSVPLAYDQQGRVTVSREIGALGLSCREIVFSVEQQDDEALERAEFYTAIICRSGDLWKWASAEPATERWGSLQ